MNSHVTVYSQSLHGWMKWDDYIGPVNEKNVDTFEYFWKGTGLKSAPVVISESVTRNYVQLPSRPTTAYQRATIPTPSSRWTTQKGWTRQYLFRILFQNFEVELGFFVGRKTNNATSVIIYSKQQLFLPFKKMLRRRSSADRWICRRVIYLFYSFKTFQHTIIKS
jgi:hypothetical protein